MRPRPTLLLLLLLAVPLAGAATDPGARDPLEPSGDVEVTAATLARANGRIVYGTTDPGDNIADPPTLPGGDEEPGPNVEVWFVYEPDGLQELETGTVDPPQCTAGPTEEGTLGTNEDCKTAVSLLATNDLGTRQVVAGVSELGVVLLFQPLVGSPSRLLIEDAQEVAFLDMDAAGQAVAVAYRIGVDTWRVVSYAWSDPEDGSGAVSEPWGEDEHETLPARPTGLSMADDGAYFAVSAGETYIRYDADSDSPPRTDNQFPGTGESVAMAGDDEHTSVMGTSAGRLTLHDDATLKNDQLLNFRRADSPITTVAITDDASIIAWGNGAGTFGMGLFQNGIFQVLGEFDVQDEPDAIALDGTGETAAVLVGNTLHLFGRSGNEVLALWNHTPEPAQGASNIGALSITGDGSMILAAHSSGVLLYDAVLGVEVEGDSPTLTPGQEGTLTLRVTNTGNRLATTELDPEDLDGWVVTPAVDEVVVAPDETVQVLVAVTPAASAEPGPATVTFITNVNGTDVTHEVGVDLERVIDWAVDMREGAPDALSVDAGQPGVFRLYVENRGNTPRAAPLRLTVSEDDWDVRFESGTGTIDPGTRADLDVRVTPPAGALELDEATVTVRLDGFGNPIELRAVVGAVFDVRLEAPGGITIEDGRSHTFNVTVRNTGNTQDDARLSFGDLPAGWEGRFSFGLMEHTVRDIAPGDQSRVQVTIEVPVGSESATPYIVSLYASGSGDAEAEEEILVTVVEPAPEDPDNGSPGLPLVGLLAAVGVAFAVRRR